MEDHTIAYDSAIGQRLDNIGKTEAASYLTFNNAKIGLVSKITMGRSSDNSIVVNNRLASRNHALIQKIKNDYYLKDMGSTNGTYLNGTRITPDKYTKLSKGDKITIGNDNLVMS